MRETKFKKTDVGVFPIDWQELAIKDLGSISKGKGISRSECGSGYIPCVRYGEIYTDHNDYIKYFRSFISKDVAKTSRRLHYGELLFTGSGETKEEIGKCVAFIDNIEAYVGGDIIIVTPDLNEYDPLFLGFLMNDRYVIHQKSLRGQGDAVVHITGKTLSTIQIVLPSLDEQRKIAKALSDIDGLIQSLTKLIEKKKNIKTATMQQLLTGKKRLEGFSEPWVETEIGSLCTVIKGEQLNRDKMNGDAIYPVYNGGISPSGYHSDYNTESGTIIISEGGNSCGYVNYVQELFWRGGHCYGLFGFNGNNDFFYQMLKFREKDIMKLRAGSGLPNIQKNNLNAFIVKIPNNIIEQTAIATILSDMDAEISALEKKKAKYESIKKGMMQELLTGKIRLI